MALNVVLVVICILLAVPSVFQLKPELLGADKAFVVIGWSMAPTLNLGDIVFVKEGDIKDIQIGDIIAIQGEKAVFTHRVMDINGDPLFLTKGDANEDPDGWVEDSKVIGRVIYAIPTGIVRTPIGYFGLFILPAFLLVGRGIYSFYTVSTATRRTLKRWRRKAFRYSVVNWTSVLLIIILGISVIRLIAPIVATGAYFTDTETLYRNTIQAGVWRVPSTITCMLSNSTIRLGSTTLVFGKIEPKVEGAKVTITFECGDIVINDTATTDGGGYYGYEFKPPESGVWEIVASWEGSEWYYGASSEIALLEVENSEP